MPNIAVGNALNTVKTLVTVHYLALAQSQRVHSRGEILHPFVTKRRRIAPPYSFYTLHQPWLTGSCVR
jgi:ATP-dependent protease ClpP protease subunit